MIEAEVGVSVDCVASATPTFRKTFVVVLVFGVLVALSVPVAITSYCCEFVKVTAAVLADQVAYAFAVVAVKTVAVADVPVNRVARLLDQHDRLLP